MMLNLLYVQWDSFGNEDLYEILEEFGYRVVKLPFRDRTDSEQEVMQRMGQVLQKTPCDVVFSYNYFPSISNCCKQLGLLYISWVYDSPYLQVYSYTMLNPCNRVFLFDYAVYEELHQAGIPTVYYMPLGVNMKRMERMKLASNPLGYREDISFVGSLYSEKKHRLYDKFQTIDPYAKGYLDGIIACQKNLHGAYILQDALNDTILAEMEKAYPTDPNSTSVLSPKAIYADFVLARQVTAIERREILETLGKQHAVSLFTYEETSIPGIKNKGKIDYYDQMPYLFHNSKINLNITLRSIKTGIPLRAKDIMGAGGFLLSNYQSELLEYFVPGEEFVYYEDLQDLQEKAAYYLEQDKLRMEIAHNAVEKMKKEHDLRVRISQMFDMIFH